VLPGIIRCHPLAYLALSPPPPYHPADRKAPTDTGVPGVMARSIVSSPVDPIKDYGETIVACAARTATLPPPPAGHPDATPGGYIRDGFYVNGETFDPAPRDAETPKSTPVNAIYRIRAFPPLLPPRFPGISWGFSVARCFSADRARSPNEYSVHGEQSRELTLIDLGKMGRTAERGDLGHCLNV